jgi:energy-coupling factor transporter ATP-binding protein EcfA2
MSERAVDDGKLSGSPAGDPGKPSAIEIRGLSFAYASASGTGYEAPTLRGVDLTVSRGAINVIIGSSGCGKTTLLRCLTGIIPSIIKGDLCGSVKLNGREIARDAALIKPNEIALTAGLVMQEPDHQIVMTTVEDDIAFGPENRMVPPDAIRRAVDDAARVAGLSERLTDDPATLSGGGKQRLAIAGVLAAAPQVLLFDEPMSGLDDDGRAMFAVLIQDLKNEGKTIVIVEHDYEELSFADAWILMKDGEIVGAAAPKEIDRGLLEDGLWR